MFTGIVEEIGTVRTLRRGAHSAVLSIDARTVLERTRLGDSIAVNGVCLTVTSLERPSSAPMSCTRRCDAATSAPCMPAAP